MFISIQKTISVTLCVINNMKILIVGLNYSPDITGIGKYTGEMAEWLGARGHHVRVVTAPPYYPQWKVQKPYKAFFYKKETVEGVDIYRCPLYVPTEVSTLKRVIHLLSFSMSSAPLLLSMIFWKPDVVVNPVPSLFSSPLTALAAKLCKAKSVMHVQDYEVEAMLGLGMSNRGFVSRLARGFERWALGLFSKVSTISHSMMRKAVEKGVPEKNIIFFPNWSDTAHFQKEKDPVAVRERFGIAEREKLILYSGNVGDKQGLEQVIGAADILKDEGYVFVVVGDGAGKKKLVELAHRKKLENIKFFSLQPFDLLPSILGAADCHLVVQRKGVADAVLPSKLTNILAVGGNAVITAEEETELGILCEQHNGIAVRVEPESIDELVKGIQIAVGCSKPNAVAMGYAKKFIDKEFVLERFEQSLLELQGNRI